MSRVIKIQNENTNGHAGYCLDVVDLFLPKAAAGRDKHREFCVSRIRYGYVAMQAALDKMPPMQPDQSDGFVVTAPTLVARIRRWAKSVEES
jgi:hypothetical protein